MNKNILIRLAIFLVIIVLAIVPFASENPALKVISAIVLILFIGFVLFYGFFSNLQGDSISEEEEENFKVEQQTEEYLDEEEESSFEIISKSSDSGIEFDSEIADTPTIKRKQAIKPHNLKEKYDAIVSEGFPSHLEHKDQFAYVLEKLLIVVKETYKAHSAIYFWYNPKYKKLTLEKFSSESKDIRERKFDLQDDVLSNIVHTREPEILNITNPNAEMDIIRYYDNPAGIKSFVGVPLFYNNVLTAILTVDSTEYDAFDVEDIYSLGHVVRLISILITMFEEKFAENEAEQRVNALLEIIKRGGRIDGEDDLARIIENSVKHLQNWDACAFIYYHPEKEKFISHKILNRRNVKYIGVGLDIELEGTLIGKAIMSGREFNVKDVTKYDIPRFNKIEDITLEGSFLAIPLEHEGQIYGVICFENLKKHSFVNDTVEFYKTSFKILAYTLYNFSTQKVLRSLIAKDVTTKTLTLNTFRERVSSDLMKAQAVSAPGALAVVRIDDIPADADLFNNDPFPKALQAISSLIRSEISDLWTVGRVDERSFGVYFFNINSKDAQHWSERLRAQIARRSINIGSQAINVTVSICVTSATNIIDFDKVIDKAHEGLAKSLEKGVNSVRLY